MRQMKENKNKKKWHLYPFANDSLWTININTERRQICTSSQAHLVRGHLEISNYTRGIVFLRNNVAEKSTICRFSSSHRFTKQSLSIQRASNIAIVKSIAYNSVQLTRYFPFSESMKVESWYSNDDEQSEDHFQHASGNAILINSLTTK